MNTLSKNILTTNKKLNSIVGRNHEIIKILRIFLKENQNSIVLVGDKGVGKNAIVEGLAFKIKNKTVNLNNNIIELSVDEIIDGLMNDEEFDFSSFFKKDIYFIRNSSLLFNQTLLENRKTSKFLNKLVNNSESRLILTMNFADYKKYIENDPILSRIFDSIKIGELDIYDIKEILKIFINEYSYDESIIDEVISLSTRYLRGSMQPARSLSVLDEITAYLNLNNKKYIEINDVKKIISEKSGIPIEALKSNEREHLSHLEEIINSQVIGQEFASKKISEVLKRSRVGIKDPNRPLASFLFIGSSGVGKTEMAKVLAETMFNSRSNLIRLDMSEYGETHNVQRLVGAPPGYIGYEEGGQLTNPVYDNPYSLLLLDELEKANSKVHDIFLQVLDEGRLTDGQGRTVDFRNTIIISTSNAAYSNILEGVIDYAELNDDEFMKRKVYPNLVKYFRPEFLNRFDEVIIFAPLNKEQLNRIAMLQIKKLQKRLLEQGIEFKVSNETIEKILSASKSKLFGAREVNRLIQKYIENPIANQIITNPDQKNIYI